MSSTAIAMAGGKSARQQRGDAKTNPKRTQQQDSNQYQVPYQQQATGPYATSQVPYFYNQPLPLGHFSGAHTISRANNLHKQFAGDNQPTSMPKGGNQPSGGPSSLVYYDQPYLGYASGPLVGYPPMLAGGGPCTGAAMSLAVREPKGRGPIPFIDGGGTIGPALMRHYAAEQRLQQQQRHSKQLVYQEAPTLFSPLELNAHFNKPLCRCRVMYLGSSVPHITKNGLHGIQEPLRHLYPEEKFSSDSLRRRTGQRPAQNMTIDISHLSASLGIDSWLSVWSNGLLLENVDEFGRDIKRFFSIESLHYCAAVRHFDTSTLSANKPNGEQMSAEDLNNNNNNGQDSLNSSGIEQDQENRKLDEMATRRDAAHNQLRRAVRFLPLDAPIFQYPNMMDPNHPPVFAAIMRRTSGVKVLECHAFICRRDAASNALVRCCTHAYADFLSAKRMSAEFGVDARALNEGRPNHYQTDRVGRRSRAATSMQRNSIQAGELAHGLKASKRQEPARRPARSLSTGGTNSQEMTHSDENSLDAADSEDNYAIILRQSVGGHVKAPAAAHRPGDASRRRTSRAAKGSSKSLFRGFMPNEQLAAQKVAQNELANDSASSSSRRRLSKTAQFASRLDSTSLRAGDRLSHSLDFLQAAPGAYSPDGPDCDSAQPARDSIKYSIVSNKQRRHSKSMQQLVRVTNGTAGAPPTEPAETGGRISFAWTRAASCQNIARGSLSRSSSISSDRRRRGQRRRRRSGSRRSSVSSAHNQNSLVGSQSKLNKLADGDSRQDPRSRARSRQLDTSTYIYATCSGAEESPLPAPLAQASEAPAAQVRILRADCCAANQAVSSSSSSGSSKAKKSSRRHREQQQQQVGALNQAFVEPIGGYYHFMHPPPPPPPLPAGVPLDQHRASYYNPTGLLYCPPATPFYGAAPQMGVPPPPQQPAAYYPYHQQQQQHAVQAGHLLVPHADPSLAYNGAHLLPGTSKSTTLKHPSGKASKEVLAATLKRESKLARKSQTLATRFRCLSPPLSFLQGGPDRHSGAPLPPTNGVSQQQQREAHEQHQVDPNNNRQSVSSMSSLTTSNSCQPSPSHIVSGKPGFMGPSSGIQMAPPAKNGRDRPKMSWIKRLSLTLSSGSATNTRQNSRSSSSRAEQAAEFYRNIQEAETPQELIAASGELAERVGPSANRGANLSPLPSQSGDTSPQANQNSDPETQHETISKQAETGDKSQGEHETKSKRKKGGFFSGSLTLGRKSRIKSSP